MSGEGAEGVRTREWQCEFTSNCCSEGRRSFINSTDMASSLWDPTPRKINPKVFTLQKKLSSRLFIARAHNQGQFLPSGTMEIWEVYTFFLFATCVSWWSSPSGSMWTKAARRYATLLWMYLRPPSPSQTFIIMSVSAGYEPCSLHPCEHWANACGSHC